MKMKKVFLIMFSLFLLTACGGNGGQKKAQQSNPTTETKVAQNASNVYVYYFHGKQRCKTCNSVEQVAKKAIEDNYASNANVKFISVPTYEKENEALVQKYEISWNGLIIDKGGNNPINITEQAFGNAVNSPDVLVELIKSEVNKRL